MSLRALWFCYYLSLSSFAFTLSSSSYSPSSTLSDDVASLLSFKSSVTLDPSNLLSSWSLSTHHCSWIGVTCDASSGKVIALNITGANPLSESGFRFSANSSFLAGTLTASIANLTELRILSLPHNVFTGEIPLRIGELRSLEVVELQGNNFTGQIPPPLAGLQALRLLNMSYNSLTGFIPMDLIGSRNIRVVDLSNNQLSGRIGISKHSQCESVAYLKLSNNFLDRNIPTEIGKCRSLRTLLLDGNILEGSIPPDIAHLSELRILDVSRNSLTDRIPGEIARCHQLAVIVFTNPVDYNGAGSNDIFRGEYNAFDGGVPPEIFMIPTLQILWAPRANIGGQLPNNWTDSCSLRVLNLGQNYLDGEVPESLTMCKNLTFLDLSSNRLSGSLPLQLQVPCMVYFNISQNFLSGILPAVGHSDCGIAIYSLYGQEFTLLTEEDIQISYPTIQVWLSEMSAPFGAARDDNLVVNHDFSWNNFTGSLPSFLLAEGLLEWNVNGSYRLLLNNNDFSGSALGQLFLNCGSLQSIYVNMSANRIAGEIYQLMPMNCLQLSEFGAAQNLIEGSVDPAIGKLLMLQYLDLRGNKISGSLPQQLLDLKNLKQFLLGKNNLTGEIPRWLGKLTSMETLDLSNNAFIGSIPADLAKAVNLEILLLNDNKLSGVIPSTLSSLSHLTQLDVSFNNLSGHIPQLKYPYDCSSFKGNRFLHSCPDSYSAPSTGLPFPLEVNKMYDRGKTKSLVIAAAISVSVLLSVLLVIAIALALGRKRFCKLSSLTRKVLVTFADAPIELTYDNVVSATDNFNIRNLIGSGGFGSTYKAKLIPGHLVAVKRLYVGRFQGVQQFEAEIRTLGRIRHRNLVTLLGYYVGDAEMFLVYNYLSGGNLETFIHDGSGKSARWPVIYKIAVDIAQALTYLHYSCVPRIVHRDIKPSNILLDEELNAYLSDFGLARLLEVSQTHATTDVAGTFGYVAPEYATTCRVSEKADVYSFGVVLLELMSGKKCLDPSFSTYGNGFNIVAWASLLEEEGRSSELFSPELWGSGSEEHLLKILRLALSCTMESLAVRPSMKQVLEKLKQLDSGKSYCDS